ncbi:hypothetical protein KQ945_05020 [Bacillus subtilis subsp. subtilis]|nr:hypothetical protein [Bacillus subtilis subsp. subtilis]
MNRSLSRAVLPLALAALAAACTPANIRPGASVPTTVRTGQSWVVTRPVIAAQVLDTCSRSSPGREAGAVTGYWAPSRQQVEQLEARLPSLEAQVRNAADFDRQYVGIEMGGRQVIYLNAFPAGDHDVDPARTAIRACDGGAQFWGAVFDPATGSFSDVQFNGPPASR